MLPINFRIQIVPALLLVCVSGWTQAPKPLQPSATPFAAIQATDLQVRSFLNSANAYSTGKSELKTASKSIERTATPSGPQQELEEEFNRFHTAISGIDQFKKDLKNLETQVSLIRNGITSLKIVNPGSNFLGDSFADVLTRNALSILGSDVGNPAQRSRFQKIMGLIVSNPLISTAFSSNPVTSMVREAVSQAIGVSEGKIQKSTIEKFNNSIAPYLEFYERIDRAAEELQENMVGISVAINKKQSKMKRLEGAINELLQGYSGKNSKERLRSMMHISRQSRPTAQDLREILSARDVRLLDQLIERQLFVTDDFIDDPLALQMAYNEYIRQMRSILDDAKSKTALAFDPLKLEEAMRQFREI